jgi:dTDP-4-dehydrorhamnose 3,5-epimerase
MFKDARGQGDYDIFPALRGAGQINISRTYPGVIRAFHRHALQDDWWYIVSGQFEVVLAEAGRVNGPHEDKVQIKYMGPGEILRITPGVWHGFRVLGTEVGTLLYHVTKPYDANNPDEERAPYNRFHDWRTEYK